MLGHGQLVSVSLCATLKFLDFSLKETKIQEKTVVVSRLHRRHRPQMTTHHSFATQSTAALLRIVSSIKRVRYARTAL